MIYAFSLINLTNLSKQDKQQLQQAKQHLAKQLIPSPAPDNDFFVVL